MRKIPRKKSVDRIVRTRNTFQVTGFTDSRHTHSFTKSTSVQDQPRLQTSVLKLFFFTIRLICPWNWCGVSRSTILNEWWDYNNITYPCVNSPLLRATPIVHSKLTINTDTHACRFIMLDMNWFENCLGNDFLFL